MLLTRSADWIAALCKVAAAAITAAIFVIMLAQILFRYLYNASILWSEEICMLGLTWVVFLGSVVLTRNWAHVRVPLLVESVRPRLSRVLELAAMTISLAFLVFLAWLGFDAFNQGFHRTSPMLGISTRWIKLAIPVGAAMMAFLTLVLIVETLRGTHAAADASSSTPSRE